MAQRDYKPKAGASRGSKTRGGTLIGIVIGLVLGLAIAVGVAFFLNKGPKPFADKTGHDRPPAVGKGTDKSNDPNAPLYGKDARTADAKKDGKDEDRFSFYKILPGDEKASAAPDAKGTPDAKAAPDAKKDAAKGPDVAKADTTAPKDAMSPTGKEQYYLQVGAFGSPGDADNQKAKLALMGFEAKVEAGDVDGKGTIHRVRIGPYTRLDDINRVRSTLAQNGVEASLVRMKDGQK
ncbi:MAG: cell division protein [Betaproteobacteria bacterium]|nr:cell division protein [Betaproteobacteria bacterium]